MIAKCLTEMGFGRDAGCAFLVFRFEVHERDLEIGRLRDEVIWGYGDKMIWGEGDFGTETGSDGVANYLQVPITNQYIIHRTVGK